MEKREKQIRDIETIVLVEMIFHTVQVSNQGFLMKNTGLKWCLLFYSE
ncbi:hypothetical protein KHA80_02355 [Anaerobacillus sp. HL2]|nr:hypothetical protein KHA80_02355 [Anaerobacillus sp. HL2]